MNPIEEQELYSNRQALIEEKQELQLDIAKINNACCVRIQNRQYQLLQRQRTDKNSRVMQIERELGDIKFKIAANYRSAVSKPKPAQSELKILADKIKARWEAFADDPQTNPATATIVISMLKDMNPIFKAF